METQTDITTTISFDPDMQHVIKRVLIVEDVAADCIVYERMFKRMGFDEVYIAHSSCEALERVVIERQPYDLVVLDQDFRGEDIQGTEFARFIRQHVEYAQTPILVLSGRRDFDTIEQAFRAGVDDFIPKPIDLAQLEALVSEAMDARSIAEPEPKDDLIQQIMDLPEVRRDLERCLAKANAIRLAH